MKAAKTVLRDALLASPARRFLLQEPAFTIVGTGRSGTRYIARVLTESGIKTGHEAWWNPYEQRVTTRLKGEASWCAVFNLESYQGHVFHQIRDPLKVVASLATTELDPAWPGPDNRIFYEWRQRNITLSGRPTRDAVEVVLAWIRESESCSEWTYRLEDVDAETIGELADRAGLKVSRSRIRKALDAVPTSTNRRHHAALAWADLPDGESRAELMEIAGQYGYL